MFEKSRILWHLTRFEADAETPADAREAIAGLAASTGVIKRAVGFARDTREPELAAAYLVLSLTEMAVEMDAPPSVALPLAGLFQRALHAIESRRKTNPVIAMTLLNVAMGISLEALAGFAARADAATGSGSTEDSPGSTAGGGEGGTTTLAGSSPEFAVAGNMPDVEGHHPVRQYRSAGYLAYLFKDLPPLAARLGFNPVNLRYQYALLVIHEASSVPALFVLLERSLAGRNILGVLGPDGSHTNLGVQDELVVEAAFAQKALDIAKERLDIARIDEVAV